MQQDRSAALVLNDGQDSDSEHSSAKSLSSFGGKKEKTKLLKFEESQEAQKIQTILNELESKLTQEEGVTLFEVENFLHEARGLFLKIEAQLIEQKIIKAGFVNKKSEKEYLLKISKFEIPSEDGEHNIITKLDEVIDEYNDFLEILEVKNLEQLIQSKLQNLAKDLEIKDYSLYPLKEKLKEIAKLFARLDQLLLKHVGTFIKNQPIKLINLEFSEHLLESFRNIGLKIGEAIRPEAPRNLEIVHDNLEIVHDELQDNNPPPKNSLIEDFNSLEKINLNPKKDEAPSNDEINKFIAKYPELRDALNDLIKLGKRLRNEGEGAQQQEQAAHTRINVTTILEEAKKAGETIHKVMEFLRLNIPSKEEYRRYSKFVFNLVLYALGGGLSWVGNRFYLGYGKAGTRFLPAIFPGLDKFDSDPDAVSWSCFILNYAITMYCIIVVGQKLKDLSVNLYQYYFNARYRELYNELANVDPAFFAKGKQFLKGFCKYFIGVFGLAVIATRQQIAMQLKTDPSLVSAGLVGITYLAANGLSTAGLVEALSWFFTKCDYQIHKQLIRATPSKYTARWFGPDANMPWIIQQMSKEFKKTFGNNWASGMRSINQRHIYINKDVYKELLNLCQVGDNEAAFKLLFVPFYFRDPNASNKGVLAAQWVTTGIVWATTAITFAASILPFLADGTSFFDAVFITFIIFLLYARFGKALSFGVIDKIVNGFKSLFINRDFWLQMKATWNHRTNTVDFIIKATGALFMYFAMAGAIAPSIASNGTTEDLLFVYGTKIFPDWFVEFVKIESVPNTMIANLFCLPEVLDALGILFFRLIARGDTKNQIRLSEVEAPLKQVLETISEIIWLKTFAELCEKHPTAAGTLLQAIFGDAVNHPEAIFGEFIKLPEVQEKLAEAGGDRSLPSVIIGLAEICKEFGMFKYKESERKSLYRDRGSYQSQGNTEPQRPSSSSNVQNRYEGLYQGESQQSSSSDAANGYVSFNNT